MSNLNIYDRILEKAKLDSKKIRDLGNTRAEQTKKSAIEDVTKTLSLERKKLQARLDETYKTKMTEFEQSLKQDSLLNKKLLLEEVFNEAKSKLVLFNDEQLKKLVISIISKDTLNGKEKLRVNKKEYNRYLNLFSSQKDGNLDVLNKALKRDVKLSLDKETANISGGFIIIGEDFDLDHSFDAIIDMLYNNMETEIASILFLREKQ